MTTRPSWESAFEAFLWGSRLVVLIAVLASLVASLAMFYVATVDVVTLLGYVAQYHQPLADAAARAALRGTIIAYVVEVVDGYLLAAIMLIFALGLYELFISRIYIAERSEFGARLLLIRNLDDLKDRLAKVVLLILVVKFFEYALALHIERPIDLLWLGLGIALVAAAVVLSKSKAPSGGAYGDSSGEYRAPEPPH
jgi:uncharacterized membrane protein YqhA